MRAALSRLAAWVRARFHRPPAPLSGPPWHAIPGVRRAHAAQRELTPDEAAEMVPWERRERWLDRERERGYFIPRGRW